MHKVGDEIQLGWNLKLKLPVLIKTAFYVLMKSQQINKNLI